MGHNSKKKKKKVKGRGASRDHFVGSEDDQDVLANELTALAAIFQEDFKILSEPPQSRFSIKLRPYTNAMGFVDHNISALLVVRCGPGYPHKCPKLQVISEEGLSNEDADKLLDLLLVQGNLSAREGRVMIFNLVEAAQEFLSEIAPVEQTSESVSVLLSKIEGHMLTSEASVQLDTSCYCDGSFVCSSIDLFSDPCGDDTSLGGHGVKVGKISSNPVSLVDKMKTKNALLQSQPTNISENVLKIDNLTHDRKVLLAGTKNVGFSRTTSNLNVVPEETEDDSKSTSSRASDHLTAHGTMEKNIDNTTDERLELENS